MILFFIYDLLLLLALPFISKRKHHYKRLFLKIPNSKGKQTIWIHAVSVGEIKAFQPLFLPLKQKYPDAFFLLTCTTATGMQEAKRIYPEGISLSYLPFDFSWIMRRWVSVLRPHFLLFMEGDLWPNLLRFSRRYQAKIAIISAKLSQRSAKRHHLFRLAKIFFEPVDVICAQSQESYDRFLPLVHSSKLHLTGNIKWDLSPAPITALPFPIPDIPILTIASTHEKEEELLLNHLPLHRLFLILAPRHPERFDIVAAVLKQKNISFFRWSQSDSYTPSAQVLLLDCMGQLPSCFAISRLSIVAGSFIPKIGGHNLFEPCLYGSPVFFGPYAFSQKELSSQIQKANAGKEISIEHLYSQVETFLTNPILEAKMRAQVLSLTASVKGVKEKTMEYLHCLERKSLEKNDCTS